MRERQAPGGVVGERAAAEVLQRRLEAPGCSRGSARGCTRASPTGTAPRPRSASAGTARSPCGSRRSPRRRDRRATGRARRGTAPTAALSPDRWATAPSSSSPAAGSRGACGTSSCRSGSRARRPARAAASRAACRARRAPRPSGGPCDSDSARFSRSAGASGGRRGGRRGRGVGGAASRRPGPGVAAPIAAQRLVGQRVRREIARDGEELAAARCRSRAAACSATRKRASATSPVRAVARLGQPRVAGRGLGAVALHPQAVGDPERRHLARGGPCPCASRSKSSRAPRVVAVVELALRQQEQRPVLAAQIRRPSGGAQRRTAP